MSFFKRNDPSAPAARKAGQSGAVPSSSSSYERLPPDSYSQQPPSNYSQQPPSNYSQQPPSGRRVPPPQDSYESAHSPAPTARQQPPLPPRGGYAQSSGGVFGGQEVYPSEKAEYRPQQPQAAPRTYGGQQGPRVSTGSGRGVFDIAPCPSDPLALTNRLVVSGGDFPPEVEFVMVRNRFVLSIVRDPTRTLQPKHLGPSKIIRQWIGLSAVGEKVECEPFQPGNGDWAASVEMEIGFRLKRNETSDLFDSEDMAAAFISVSLSFTQGEQASEHVALQAFPNLPLTPLQPLVFDYRGHQLKITVRNVSTLEGSDGVMGVIMEGTEIIWVKDPSSGIKLKNSSKRGPTNAILAPNFKFEDMGIGGLDTEFAAIFRRAFASRIFPPGLVEKLGIQHVKGILLFGPPGTGKTLMARQIGKMLNAREPKVVNGPEILNKFVGQSEENIRKLFEDAEKEQKEKGDESGLHIIIFDELDAICKQRGSTNSGTGVGDSVVNQLLSKMDGVDQLNNVLIIGMTNRMDMIDEALLRPGRLEVHIEISLPDEAGRFQILGIHTSKMRKNGVMGDDVDLAELAALTKNFSGAEIGGLVKSATSFAFNRHVKVGSVAAFEDIDNIQIMRADFMHALDEVTPAFGVSEEELQAVVQNGIIHYSERVNDVLNDGSLLVEQVRNSDRTPLVAALLHGPSGAGKTALAATIAMASDFPFIKLISPEDMVGYSEAQKIAQLNKVFTDSYKSPLSVIVMDSLERILDWNPIGPRFSNGVLQAIVVLLGKRPPKGRRLLILATTSHRSILTDMDVLSAFDTDIPISPITSLEEVDHCLREVKLFESAGEQQKAMKMLQDARFGEEGRGDLMIGVKKLLSMAEMSRQDPEPAYNPSKSSPLSPPMEETMSSSIEMDELAESSGSSSTDDVVSPGVEDRSERISPRKPRPKNVERLLNRRAAFNRLETIAEAEHRRTFDAKRVTLESDYKGKGKENAVPSVLGGELYNSPELALSPKITLSAEPSTEPTFPQPFPRSQKLGRPPTLQTPHLSLSLPGSSSPTSSDPSTKQSSPITLLSPKPIPTPSSGAFSASSLAFGISGSLRQPDSHVEAIIRLLFVFCRVHPQWAYNPGLADIITPLYLLYAGADVANSTLPDKFRKVPASASSTIGQKRGKYAEEETFWAFASLMGDFGDLISSTLSAQSERDVEWTLARLGRRVRWADEDLWRQLCERNLDPSSPIYAYRWLSGLLTHDISPRSLLPVWDFVFSEPPSTLTEQPKIDLLIDVCAAMLLLCKDRLLRPASVPSPHKSATYKKPGLWADISSDEELPVPVTEDAETAFVRCLQLLRSYPLHAVGGIEAVLQTAFELRQARLVAGLSGDDPDLPGWTEAKDAVGKKTTWAQQASQNSISTLASLSKYTESLQQSDAAASLSKASTNWTATAMAKWSDASKAASAIPARPNTANWSASAGRLWKSVKPVNLNLSEDGSPPRDIYTSLPSTPSSQRDSLLPPKFVSPKSTIKYAHGQVPASIAARRDRSDSTNSGLSVTSLHDRLAGLASSLGATSPLPKSNSVSGPKPLLLSGSARRASNSSYGRSVSGSGPTGSSPGSFNEALLTSPPARRDYESDSTSGGLYRIGSRQGVGASPHTPSELSRRISRGGAAEDGATHLAGVRLREATNRDSIGSLPRSPATFNGFGSDSEAIKSPPNGLARKWSLTDPGTPDESDSAAGHKSYPSTTLSRRDSSDSQSSIIQRPRVVKKKFQKRPTSLRLESQGQSTLVAKFFMPSPVPELEPEMEVLPVPEPAPVPEPISIPTPQIGHLTEEDYEHVYEPAEDSFILLDAMEADAVALRAMKPSLCVEIGSGSGIASAFLSSLLGPTTALMLSTDINPYACSATVRTGQANDVFLNPILGNLLDPLLERFNRTIDVLVFNPPYVATDESEMTITQKSRGIGGAWAGGDDGMSVTNKILEQLPQLLAPGGRFYLVAVQQNKPDEIVSRVISMGFESKVGRSISAPTNLITNHSTKVVLKRRAGREHLSIIRTIRKVQPQLLPTTTTRSRLMGPRSRPVSTQGRLPAPAGAGSHEEPSRMPITPREAAPRSPKANGAAKGHKVMESADLADDEDDDGLDEILNAYE
ncbi:vesicle-fusing ATPase, partial [Tremellales sp. Uapishka_1]